MFAVFFFYNTDYYIGLRLFLRIIFNLDHYLLFLLNIMTDDLEICQEREDPDVNFGCVDGMKKVGISEASSNLLSCV